MATTLKAADVRGSIDCAIVTVREDEFEAVLERMPQRRPVQGVKQHYEFTTISTADDARRSIAVVRQLEQGQLAAYAVVASTIQELKPRCILLVGIAGGVPDIEFTLGDVLLASRVHDFSVSAVYENGALTHQQRGGSVHSEVERLLAVLPAWRQRLGAWNAESSLGRRKPDIEVTPSQFYGSPAYRKRLKEIMLAHFPPGQPARPPLFRIGPTATSNSLVKRTLLVRQWQESARQLTHIEMEAGGAYDAARQENLPLLCVRGISDIVGFKRKPEWTDYACNSAASFVLAMLRSSVADALFTPVAPESPTEAERGPPAGDAPGPHKAKATLRLHAASIDVMTSRLASASKWDAPKYYVYISDAKVEMLFAQIPHEVRAKLADEMNIDLVAISNTLTSAVRAEVRFAKLRVVNEYLERNAKLGTVDEPAAWFSGRAVAMRWGPIHGHRAVYFGGVTDQTIFGLGGSPRHVIGSEGKATVPDTSSSWSPALFDILRAVDPSLTPESERPSYARPELPDRDASALVRATLNMDGPTQNFEFVAKRLVGGPIKASIPYDVKQARILLGTPLYVAQID